MSTSHTTYRYVSKDILQFKDGTQIVNPRFFYKIHEGYGFSISHRFTGVASGGSVDLFFENPAGSGRTVYVVAVEVASLAQAWVDVYRDNKVASSGTKLTPLNLNLGKPISSVVNAEHGGTYTLGALAHSTVCPGGSLVRAVGYVVEVGETVIIPEGYNILVRATNQSASSTDLSIRIIWWEEPS